MMKWFLNKRVFSRYMFVAVAMLIAIGSLVVSHYLIKDLSKEEHNKMRIWAEATKEMINAEEDANLNLVVLILQSNTTIPIILYDDKDNTYTSANIEVADNVEEQEYLSQLTPKFKEKHEPIIIEFEDSKQYVYYDDSYTLKRLQIYPYIQLAVLTIFVLTSLIALLSTKRMEQDRIWVGLSKETAHQLGTPLSSLIAWIEYLKMKGIDESITQDMEKDIDRLQKITERFSKIGSAPTLEKQDIRSLTEQTVVYLSNRISKKVEIKLNLPSLPIYAYLSPQLYEWVIENLIKNAVDAMSGVGSIEIRMHIKNNTILLDITDTGKGISKKDFSAIFRPGHTTKSRGWGLGLSLAKRIIESYHRGKIYVLKSELGIGTSFRIEMPKFD